MNEDKSPVEERDPRIITGAVLIAIGLLLFVLQFVTGPTVSLLFLVGGAAFVAVYFSRKVYRLLVPGCILIGIGIGHLGEQSSMPLQNMSSVGLGIGFIGIYVIDKIYRGKTAWWPLIPGGILLVTGAATGYVDFGKLISKGWPLILVILGVLFLTGALGSHRRRDDRKKSPPKTASRALFRVF